MAEVLIAFTREGGVNSPLLTADPEGASERITSSGNNQVSTESSPFADGSYGDIPGGVVSITSLGGPVLIAIGQAPNAETDAVVFPVLDGQTRDFYCGYLDKVAVVDLV